MTVISFEGSIGAGKTSLTNFFSREFNGGRVLEDFEANPFLHRFYDKRDCDFETELAFVLIHYYQIRQGLKGTNSGLLFLDFSIEKDLVFARMNLQGEELRLFESAYEYVIRMIGFPNIVIYIDISPKVWRRRIFQRGRPYEMDHDPHYFDNYNERNKEYFLNNSKSDVVYFNVDDLVLEATDQKLSQIREEINKRL